MSQTRPYQSQQGQLGANQQGRTTASNLNVNQTVSKSGRVQVFQDNPVYVEREVQVPYEVVIDRPVENIIENRYYVDKEVEIPITHVTEVEVEVIKEVKKYVPRERKVEIETIYEKPYEKIIEVPIEIVKEIPVPVERVVNKHQERTILRPHRTEVVDKPVYVDKEVKVDKIVEKYVDVDVPVYIDKIYDKVVDVPEYVYRDVVIDVPRFVDVPRDVYYDKVVEVPRERIVEKEIVIDRIVEKPYTVEKIVEKKREVPVERIVEVPVYFDKIVEVPVERRVEVPYKVQKHVKKIVPRQVNVPMITTKDVEIPFERVIEEPYEVIEEIPVPIEKVVERTVDVPVYKEEQVFDYIEIEVPYERIVEVPVYKDIEVEVEIIREKFIEVPFERFVDKVVEIEKIIEKPIYNQKIVEKPIQKIVEKRVEVPIEKYVEIPKYREVQKHIRVEQKSQRSVVVEKKNSRSLRKSVKTSTISASQKNAYTSLGEGLSKYKIENLKLSLDIKSLQQQITEYKKVAQNPEYIRQQNDELRRKIQTLEQTIINVKSENITLEKSTATTKETQVIEAYSSSEIAKLENEARLLIEKNKKLVDILRSLGESTSVTNTFYVQKTMNEQSKIGKSTAQYQSQVEIPAQSSQNYTTTTTQYQSYAQPVVTTQSTVTPIGLSQGQQAQRVQTSISTERQTQQVSNTTPVVTQIRSDLLAKQQANSNSNNVFTTETRTNTVNFENIPMHTTYSSSYANAKGLESYANVGRRSQTHTIVGEPQIRTSTVTETITSKGNLGGHQDWSTEGQAWKQGQGLNQGQSTLYQTQTGTRIVEPTRIVTSNRIVESSNRGGLFDQVKNSSNISQLTQSRIVHTEGTTSSVNRNVTGDYSNNPYLNAYIDGAKKY